MVERSEVTSDVFAKMQVGQPYKSYIKTILGRVYVTVWNPFINEPEGRILSGQPNGDNEEAVVHTYSVQEDQFLRRMNQSHFKKQRIIPFEPLEEQINPQIKFYTDEELTEILNKPFLALSNFLTQEENVATIYRLENLATQLEKSEKILDNIRARAVELTTPVMESEE